MEKIKKVDNKRFINYLLIQVLITALVLLSIIAMVVLLVDNKYSKEYYALDLSFSRDVEEQKIRQIAKEVLNKDTYSKRIGINSSHFRLVSLEEFKQEKVQEFDERVKKEVDDTLVEKNQGKFPKEEFTKQNLWGLVVNIIALLVVTFIVALIGKAFVKIEEE